MITLQILIDYKLTTTNDNTTTDIDWLQTGYNTWQVTDQQVGTNYFWLQIDQQMITLHSNDWVNL